MNTLGKLLGHSFSVYKMGIRIYLTLLRLKELICVKYFLVLSKYWMNICFKNVMKYNPQLSGLTVILSNSHEKYRLMLNLSVW